MNKKILLTFSLVLLCSLVNAQTVQLRELLKEGLENNYQLRIVRTDQQQAENNATRAASGMLPEVSLGAGYDFNNYNYNYEYENSEKTRRNYSANGLDASVDLSWTIFDGFAIQTNYKRNQELESRSRIATQVAIEDYVAEFTAEYFSNIMEMLRLKNLQAAMKLSGERLRIVKARYIVGNFSRLDLLQAEVDFNVDSAAYIKQQELVFTSSIALSRLMGVDDFSEKIELVDSLIDVRKDLDYSDLLRSTLKNNSNLLFVQKDTRIAELELKSVMSRNYPYLSMDAGYSISTDIYSNYSTKRSRYHGPSAGLTLGFNIFDPTKKSARLNARLEIEKNKLQQKDLEVELRGQLLTFYQAYLNNLELLKLETVSRYVAKENYEIANERYMLGNLSGIEMREAENSLLDVENRILDVIYNTKICEISLLQISGKLDHYL